MYTLQDFLAARRVAQRPLSLASVRLVARGVMLATAALHAKGLVHLDIKPANIMWSNGHWKLIDVDGCVPHSCCVNLPANIQSSGHYIQKSNNRVAFTPLYCSPDWCRLITSGEGTQLELTPSLDVWSVVLDEIILHIIHFRATSL